MKIMGILFVAMTTVLFGQQVYPNFEFFTHTEGSHPPDTSVKFWMETSDAVWDQDHSIPQTTQELISSVNYAHATDKSETAESVPIPHNDNQYGFWHVLTQYTHAYGYGKYKVSIGYEFDDAEFYFYMDWRDCDYTDYYEYNDTWILYNASNNTVKIDWDDDDFTNNVTNITQGHTYKIWEYKSKSENENEAITEYFELYLTLSNNNNHPHLTWNPFHDESSLEYYKIYKKKSGSAWSVLTTTTNTYYTDNSETFFSPPNRKTYVYYRVSAVYDQTEESLKSNTVKAAVNEWEEKGNNIVLPEPKININIK